MIPGFLNENSGRAYPVTEDTKGALPDYAILDFGAIVYTGANYSYNQDYVYLYSVSKSGSVITFEFRSTAPGLYGKSLVFFRDVSADPFSTDFTSANTYDSSSSEICSYDNPLWEGYLTTGDMEELGDYLDTNGDLILEAKIEPELVTNFAKYHVDSITVANDDRTRATTPDECRDYCWDFETGGVIVDKSCLAGAFRFVGGYNCEVLQDDATNTITISAGVGAGKGQPCSEPQLFEGEEAPNNGLLTGGPSCGEVVRSINGVGSRIFELKAGPGVTITELPDFNKIIVNVDLSGMALCPDFDSEVSESEPSINEDECECGPN